MFTALANLADGTATLMELGKKYVSKDVAIVVLCYDRVLHKAPQFSSSSTKQISTRLTLISIYLTSVTGLLKTPQLHLSAELSRIAGFKPAIHPMTMQPILDQYRVFAGSVFFKRIDTKRKEMIITRDGRDVIVLGRNVDENVRVILEERVRLTLQGVHTGMSDPTVLPRPCLDIVIEPGVCKKVTCEFDHNNISLTIEATRNRLLVHLQLISVLDTMHSVTWPSQRSSWPVDTLRWWIWRVYSLAYPISYQLGNEQIVPSKHQTNADNELSAFYSWLERFAQALDSSASTFLSDILGTVMLAYRWPNYKHRTFFRSSAHLFVLRSDKASIDDVINYYAREDDKALVTGVRFFTLVKFVTNVPFKLAYTFPTATSSQITSLSMRTSCYILSNMSLFPSS